MGAAILKPERMWKLLLVAAATVCAQDPLVKLPGNYHWIFENETVRVIAVKYLPHEN